MVVVSSTGFTRSVDFAEVLVAHDWSWMVHHLHRISPDADELDMLEMSSKVWQREKIRGECVRVCVLLTHFSLMLHTRCIVQGA